MTELSGFTKSLVGQVHVRSSAMNPLLWLCAVGGLLCLLAAYYMPDYRGIFVFATIGIFAFSCLAYAYFAIKDPDRLQSEEYQAKMHEIQLMKGMKSQQAIEDESISSNLTFLQNNYDNDEVK